MNWLPGECGDGPVTVLYWGIQRDGWGPHMTLAIAVCTDEGILLAADGLLSRPEMDTLAIMSRTEPKLFDFGRFGIATAGFQGLTEEWLHQIRKQALLEPCTSVDEARVVCAELIRDYMQKFVNCPANTWPVGALLLAGYDAAGRPHAYALHSAKAFQAGPFQWIGSRVAGVATDAFLRLFADQVAPWRTLALAKRFSALALGTATSIDASVGPFHRMALVTRTDGYRDISWEIPVARADAAATIERLRCAFDQRPQTDTFQHVWRDVIAQHCLASEPDEDE